MNKLYGFAARISIVLALCAGWEMAVATEEAQPEPALDEAQQLDAPDESDSDQTPEEQIVEEDFEKEDLLSQGRSYLGKSYIDLTQTIDGFLAGKRLEREFNSSYLKLLTQNTWFERSENAYDVKLKGKIDLPGTEKRYKLFIDSDPDEQNSLEERNRTVSQGERIRERSSVAGIEFGKVKPLTRWKTSFSLGGKLDSGFKPLVRARLRKNWVLNEKWTSYFHQDVWHLDGIGWGETSRSEFTRSLSEHAWIQFLTEVEYQDDDPAWQYVHSWRIDQILDEAHALTYRIGVTGETPEDVFEDSRFISFSWRSRIYEDWAFLHLTPEVYFASEDNYNSEAAFTVKFEIFLTD